MLNLINLGAGGKSDVCAYGTKKRTAPTAPSSTMRVDARAVLLPLCSLAGYKRADIIAQEPRIFAQCYNNNNDNKNPRFNDLIS